MSDRKTIYLDDAIDAICKARSMEEDYHKCDGYPETSTWCDNLVALRALPSAQPEPCEDAVSRHRLLSDLEELIVAWEKYPVMAEQKKGVEAAIGYVEAIPSVTPKRKTGKWISLDDSRGKYNDYGFKCSECGEHSDYEENFCPNCGADMRGDGDV